MWTPLGRGGRGEGHRRGQGVNDFCCTDDILDDLEIVLSREPLGTYLDAARKEAVRLHVWNTRNRTHSPFRNLHRVAHGPW